eukprot:364558-Chlamydomonas_euryale.AAC.11
MSTKPSSRWPVKTISAACNPTIHQRLALRPQFIQQLVENTATTCAQHASRTGLHTSAAHPSCACAQLAIGSYAIPVMRATHIVHELMKHGAKDIVVRQE